MADLDQVPWAGGVAIRSHGVRVGVRVTDVAGLGQVLDYLPPEYVSLGASSIVDRLYSLQIDRLRQLGTLHADGFLVGRDLSLDLALRALEADIQTFVSEASRRFVFVHAGVVEWRGRAILIPGYSYSGKTTLVEQLLRAGATYYSDEYAVLNARGLVRPFARKLGVRGSEPTVFYRRSVTEIGAGTGMAPIPVGLVLVTEYQEGAEWQPRHLSPAEGALQLLHHTLRARRGSEFVLSVLQRALARARILAGPRGDAAELARTLLGGITSWDAMADD